MGVRYKYALATGFLKKKYSKSGLILKLCLLLNAPSKKKSSREFFNENNGRVRGIHKRGKFLIFQIFQSPALLKMSHKMLKFYGGVDFFC